MAGKDFIESSNNYFKYYKSLADRAFEQMHEDDFDFIPAEGCNSIAIIIQHLCGNLLSRWTGFLYSDGEKPWRQRDAEFEKSALTKEQLLNLWEAACNCTFEALDDLKSKDLKKIITIRGEPLSVVDAINRNLNHYAYHVGQIIFAAKIIKNKNWKNLSMPKKRI
ncbi:MAG: DUF1572 family protein [Ginsengibacter sp.]